ncbi:MAG: hypothetical protein ACREJC_20180 [Tepidisphaeraceae bacterium]
MSTTSPTQRTLAGCRSLGWQAAVVEKWNPHAYIRQDLFGCIDILCLLPTCGGVTGIQATTGTNVAARCAKIEANPLMVRWLRAGNRLFVVGWRKVGERGKRKTWQARWVEALCEEKYGKPPEIGWREHGEGVHL